LSTYRIASAGTYFAWDFAVELLDAIVVFRGPFIVALNACVLTRILACFFARLLCLALSPFILDMFLS
jgi:hypothetical protein